jgi:hypothetical protein
MAGRLVGMGAGRVETIDRPWTAHRFFSPFLPLRLSLFLAKHHVMTNNRLIIITTCLIINYSPPPSSIVFFSY